MRSHTDGIREVASALALVALVACSDDAIEPLPDEGYEIRLAWPLGGTDGADWVINNYVDLDPGAGLLDYRGGAKVYDGHRGVDIDVPNFRWMDDDFPVRAAAPGTVTGLHDGEFDRNVSCVGDWNYVQVTHEDGTRAIYGHMKKGSVAVSMGEAVSVGRELGVVGSSGCSTQAHLHFEMRSAEDAVIDPFQSELWISPPPYDPPLTFMDFNLKAGAITGVDELKDPPGNLSSVAAGETIGIGLSMAGGAAGDVVRVTLEGGDGAVEYDLSVTFDRVWRHTYWYWNRTVPANPGTWTLTVYTNATEAATYTFTVT